MNAPICANDRGRIAFHACGDGKICGGKISRLYEFYDTACCLRESAPLQAIFTQVERHSKLAEG